MFGCQKFSQASIDNPLNVKIMNKLSPKRPMPLSPRFNEYDRFSSANNIQLHSDIKLSENKSESKIGDISKIVQREQEQLKNNKQHFNSGEQKQKNVTQITNKMRFNQGETKMIKTTQKKSSVKLEISPKRRQNKKINIKKSQSKSFLKEMNEKNEQMNHQQEQIEAKRVFFNKIETKIGKKTREINKKEAELALKLKDQYVRESRLEKQKEKYVLLNKKHLKQQKQQNEKKIYIKREEYILKSKLRQLKKQTAENCMNQEIYQFKIVQLSKREQSLVQSEIQFSRLRKTMQEQKKKVENESKLLIGRTDKSQMSRKIDKNNSYGTVQMKTENNKEKQQKQEKSLMKRQITSRQKRQQEKAEQYQLDEPISKQNKINLMIDYLNEAEIQLQAREKQLSEREQRICNQELAYLSIGELLTLKAEKIEVIHQILRDKGVRELHIRLFFNWKEGQEKCIICNNNFNDDELLTELRCGHDFHSKCIQQWLLQENSCPNCKKEQKKNVQ